MRKRSGLSITVIALALVAISASPVLATAPDMYLHAGGILDNNAPTATTPQQIDSGTLTYAGANPWVLVGRWSRPDYVTGVGQYHLWLGLKNSDDQGTNFDIRIVVDGGAGVFPVTCLTGITRNPALAKEYNSFPDGGGGQVNLFEVFARIGTTDASVSSAPKCAGHASATGLRLYYDSVNRRSGLHS